MNSVWKSRMAGLVKLLFAAGLIYWLSQSGRFDWEMLGGVLFSPYALVFLLLCFGNLLINNLRWLLLMRNVSINISFMESMKLSLIGIFFNYMMPGGVGGDLVKGYYIVKENPEKRTAAATSVLLDRVIGFASMSLMALLALFGGFKLLMQDWRLQSLALMLAGIFGGFLLVCVIGSSSRFMAYLEASKWFAKINFKSIPLKILQAFHQVSQNPKVILQTFVLSIFSQTCLILVVYFTSNLVLDIPLSLMTTYFAVPLGMMVSAAPIAPAGIGVGQVALYSFFSMMQVSDPNVGSTGISVIQIMLFIWGVVGSYFYVRMGSQVNLEQQSA
jgi:uncharacterized protein (TIRG00374 family)